MADFYHDTDERMRSDAAFCNAVHYLMMMASEHGFTPGELKQIAFRAALELEMRRPPPPIVFRDGKPEFLRKPEGE